MGSPILPRFLVCVLVFVFLGGELRAGPDTCPGLWRVLRVPSPDGKITAILAHPDGRVFVATQRNGLRVYGPTADGTYDWTTILASRGGLANNTLNDLALLENELWIATGGSGINIWDLDLGTWSYKTTANSSIPADGIRRVKTIEEPGDPDSVWISTNSGAAWWHWLRLIPLSRYVWTTYDTSDGLPHNQVHDVAVRFVGRELERETYFGTFGGVTRLIGTTMTPISNPIGCAMDTADRIVVDGNDDVWFNARVDVPALRPPKDGGGAGAIRRYDGVCQLESVRGRNTWTKWPRYGQDMATDADRRLWLGAYVTMTVSGGEGSSHDQGAWCVFTTNFHGIDDNDVSAVEAPGENTWFGHEAGDTISLYSPTWDQLSPANVNASGTPQAVLVDGQRLFLASGGGVAARLSDTGPWTHHALDGNSSNITSLLRVLEAGRDGNILWVGTASNGLYRVRLGSGATQNWTKTTTEQLPSNHVRDIVADKRDRLWLAMSAGLVVRGNGYWMTFTDENSPLLMNDVRALVVDGVGRVWAGTAGAGITVLDPDGDGSGAWSAVTTTQGLPSNEITALAMESTGAIWAGTEAGAARWDPETDQWTVHDVASGSLPNDRVTAIAITLKRGGFPRVWVGTRGGVARIHGSIPRHYHVSGSSLASDAVRDLSADGKLLAVSAGDGFALREDLDGVLGNFTPEIDSITPMSGAPSDIITIQGNHFDDRRPEYNTVTIGQNAAGSTDPAPFAEIVSVSQTQLRFRIPDLAESGRIKVMSHCLEVTSTERFEIAPRIDVVFPTCLGRGSFVTIDGAGFSGLGGAQVRIGNGSWRDAFRPPESQSPNRLRVRVQNDDTNGAVQVMNGNGQVAVSAQSVSIGNLVHSGTRIQQGIEGMPLIWGKRSLVHLDFEASGCSGQITRGTLFWKKTGGGLEQAGIGFTASSGGTVVPVSDDEPTGFFTGIDFVAEFESYRSALTDFFSFSQFNGVRAVLENNGVEILTVDIPRQSFNFINPGTRLKFISQLVATPENVSGTNYNVFWDNAFASWRHLARIYPQQDYSPIYGAEGWLKRWVSFHRVSSADLSDGSDDFDDICDLVDDSVDPEFGEFAIALIDEALYIDKTPPGRAPNGPHFFGATGVVFNILSPTDGDDNPDHRRGATGRVMAHEGGHMMGLVDDDSSNYDHGNDSGGHSKYDEGEDTNDDTGCAVNSGLTYRNALLDQVGGVKRLYRLDDGPPVELVAGACNARPKSLMSYAPSRLNGNAFMEPLDYQLAINFILGLKTFAEHGAFFALGDGAGLTTWLRFRGSIDRNDQVNPRLAYLFEAEDVIPMEEASESEYELVLLGEAGETLLRHRFVVSFETAEGDASLRSRFNLLVPFPEDADRIELQKGKAPLWGRDVSANAPTVELTTPSGGVIEASADVQVSWTSSDLDGDPLQFALAYSADGGATWSSISQYIEETEFLWHPGFVAPSDNALLRLRASDGFNTTTVLSAPFRLLPHPPVAYIAQPTGGSTFLEGERIDLSGNSLAPDGVNSGEFSWFLDNLALGSGATSELPFAVVGEHILRLEVTAYGLVGVDETTITVLPDFDHDGLPNDYEFEHGFNPLDIKTGSKDSDDDGLNNNAERHFGTDPLLQDTDGDGVLDGDEVKDGTDPTEEDDVAPDVPVLRVGTDSIGFSVSLDSPVSDEKTIWVTNPGAGSVTWSLEGDIPWLGITPAGGTAPTEVMLVADGTDMAVGSYDGTLLFTAGGIEGSPHTLEVRLEVKASGGPPPTGERFVRGDVDSDGVINITDPVNGLNFLFLGGKKPTCIDALDTNDDGVTNITDASYQLNHLFIGGPPMPAPYPLCGEDPTADSLNCDSAPNCP